MASLLFARVQKRGIVTCLDTAMPNSQGDADVVDWPTFLSRCCPTWIFMPSIEEAMFMMYLERYKMLQVTGFMTSLTQEYITGLAQTFIDREDRGAHIVGLKLGDQGLCLRTGLLRMEQVDATSGILSWLALQERLKNGWTQWHAQIPLIKLQIKGRVFAGPADKTV